MQEALERRGKELLCLMLVLAGLAVAAMLVSYTPNDPNWMVATDTPPQNLLGRFGASMSAILIMIIGYASYLMAAGLVVWGLRLTLHKGEERALSRLIMLPFAIAACSVFMVSFPPGSGWQHSFSLGGLFGDTVMGVLVNILPVSMNMSIAVLGVAMGVASLGLSGYALGVTRSVFVSLNTFELSRFRIPNENARSLLGVPKFSCPFRREIFAVADVLRCKVIVN